jgi:rod shape-determining protein MreD
VKPLATMVFALLLSALQASLLRFVGGGAFTLLLPVACVVYLAINAGNVDGSVGAAGVGYVLDLSAGTPKGLMTFLAVAVFVGVRAVNAAIDVRGRLGFAALTVVATFLLSLGAILLLGLVSAPGTGPGLGLLPRALVEAVATGALSPLIYEGMKKLDGLFRREEPGLLR